MKNFNLMMKIKELESHCYAGLAATKHFNIAVKANQSLMAAFTFKDRDIMRCHNDLEGTYIVHIFAVFEVSLREYWQNSLNRRTKPPVKDLINGVASRLSTRSDVCSRAQAVRDYRNYLVHGGNAQPVTIADARSYLCTFLSDLPREW